MCAIHKATDQELKRVCEELISAGSDSATQSLGDALKPVLGTAPTPSATVTGNTATFKQTCEKEVRRLVEKLRLYLDDPKTVAILVAPMQANIVRRYEEHRNALESQGRAGVDGDMLSSAELRQLLREWSEGVSVN